MASCAVVFVVNNYGTYGSLLLRSKAYIIIQEKLEAVIGILGFR